ncbi:4Fe-4S ferredoxin N-terminal domain-containing protein [Halorubrum sp. SY-15]|jgi:hypothetical protein|uniref:4Fe-4S ferredoxin N-terminal domain-containing protein n=1 Tax=Halorubrum sp. SY-15 TaxID=3402277 RepID=UPI003EBB1E57
MSDSTDPSADGGLDPLDLVGALEEAPAESEYDQELGRRMGVDAMRVANGELDERAFHEKYESALLAEFGDDYEPAEVMADE